ncbi:OLC1v1006017C5 [Oldenlandia corymbosa var. corymbosa]|uniref:OLC1v1006017C5 n=1 Tax=Oldenlandia corymbosa var. corymbosa TaxID=529605 RepID=A0AAV1DIG7_OLDCO|nr:OLC1v1006017C5 [Oldenlandia corymbosa var. corymbosa]
MDKGLVMGFSSSVSQKDSVPSITDRILVKMREGLRSCANKLKGMFNLNEVPVEDDGSSSKSPPRSSNCSAAEKVGSELDLAIPSNAVDVGAEVTRGDNGGDFSRLDGEIPGRFEGNNGCAAERSVQKGSSESTPLEGRRDAAPVDVPCVNAISGVKRKSEATGKGQRGRKRKVVSSEKSYAGGLKGTSIKEVGNEEHGQDAVEAFVCALPVQNPVSVNKGLTKIRPLKDNKNADRVGALHAINGVKIKDEATGKGRPGRERKMAGCELSSVQSVERVSLAEKIVKAAQVEEDGSKHEMRAHTADVGGDVAGDPTGKTDESRQIASKGRRGRKRKVLVASGGNNDNLDTGKTKRLASDRIPQIVGRVLRSRTREAHAAELEVCAGEERNVIDTNPQVELEVSASGNLDMEIEERASSAVKRGRGRPPAAKRGRGRPPKLHGKNWSSKASLRNKTKLVVHKEVTLPGGNVVKGHKLVKLRKRKVKSALLNITHKHSNVDKNETSPKPKKEKQLLKEEIVDILKKAGWTIDYRPRNGKDYLDAVYVDGQGRTHWSVTLAYQKLKAKIEGNTADEKEKSAFRPIAADRISKLFRITKDGKKSKKGRMPGRNKNGGESSARENSGSHRVSEQCEQENSKACTRNEEPEGGRTLLGWLLDMGTISLGDRVQCINRKRTDTTPKGKITRVGICCECCGKVLSLADFEYHHRGSALGQPLQNICLETGQSLLQCLTKAWKRVEEIHNIGFNFVNLENDPADDTCNFCNDGGNLICCDGCPSTFHQSCLQIQKLPTGDWHCIYCSCKFCGMVCWENSLGNKVLGPNFSGNKVPDPDYFGYITCLLCEEKFHVSCALRKEGANINTEVFQFCGSGCQKLFENLQKLLGVKHELKDGYSWTILRRQDLSGTADPLKVESNSKLAIALSIIDECFTPIIDERSGINIIRNVCYSCGSNLKRLNYTTFCTFILEKNDELVSAATIRVHGNKLAEMPFIGTRFSHRRKGMARLLLTAIETALCSIDVEKLVIPAVSELSETWTKVFGFVPLEESKRLEMKYMSLVLFPGNNMLEKPLCKGRIAGGKMTAAGMDPQPSKEHVIENNSPTDDACTADVGSGLHLNCNVSDPGRGKMNGLANSISSKDEHLLCT